MTDVDPATRCLWCHAELDDAATFNNVVECSCGVRYARWVVEHADRDEWESIRRREERWDVQRDGHEVIVTDRDARFVEDLL